jgi:hypothetical protein
VKARGGGEGQTVRVRVSGRWQCGTHHLVTHPQEDAIARHDRENPQDPPPPRHPVRPAALFFTRAHSRLYRPSVTQFSSKAPPHNSRLALQFQKLENTIHTYVQEANLVA